MTIEQLLAEQTRLATATDRCLARVRTAERRYRRSRTEEARGLWDQALAEQEQALAAMRANTVALREAVGG